jgi:hypothetical protein
LTGQVTLTPTFGWRGKTWKWKCGTVCHGFLPSAIEQRGRESTPQPWLRRGIEC